MILCQQCKRPHQLYLCDNCQTQLANMLDQLPWLIEELDNRIQQLDRISLGTIGRNRRPSELSVIDFDAAETARTVRKTLLHWVTTIARRHTGRIPPGLDTVETRHLAAWLGRNVDGIARLDLGDHHGHHQLYRDIDRLVGTDQRGGSLVRAINRQERHFAGPCPTIRTHAPNGEPIECGTMLYADVDQDTVECPDCKRGINVDENRHRTNVKRDLLTEPKLLEALANLGEKVSRVKFYQWVREKRIRPRGWIHQGRIVQHRIRRGDPAVYSLAKARKLRAREQQQRGANTHDPAPR